MRCGVLILALLALAGAASAPVQAQQGKQDANLTRINEVAQELRQVTEQMRSFDPEARIAYLESLVAEGNARKIERGIRFAVASDDAELRAVGMRAYFAATRDLFLEFILTPAEKKLLADAEQNRSANVPSYLALIDRAGRKVKLSFEDAPLNSVRGRVRIGSREPVEYAMRGERMTFSGPTVLASNQLTCIWELRPTRELNITANVSCEGVPRRLQMDAEMF